MKAIKIIAVAILALTAFHACNKEDQVEKRFEVNGLNDSYIFAPDLGQKAQFEVISDNVLWEITFSPADPDWLNVSPLRSLGGYETVVIAPLINDSGASRECQMTLTSENGFSKTVRISQRGE